ncbi:hypothetical protein CDV50_10335 [Haematobacter massiliensis]|uniref:DEAD/DEAH box helicase family protein n=1 Tax=Haematobacter massiliensis TaxID=195105 RepID=UPI000B49D9A2|nr:DEAD/DEAH box helicase family protein [Haematobacter massiliensis]OWJ71394.1 hypothetical protein CDV50_10335 [Haematobacter massiliensis]
MFDLFQAPQASQPKTLREHQVRAIDMLRQSFGLGNRRTVVQMPTGAGKTLTAAKIIEGALAKRNAVIFTAPAISLIDQTVSAFEAEGIRDIGVMQANHPRTDRLARVQIASVQTLARREIPEAAMVIVDECHMRAAVVEALMDARPDVFFVGLSATPWAKGMGLRWQDLVIPCTIGDLIGAGYLSKFTAFAPDVPDLSGVKTVAGDYAEDGLADVMGEGKLVASVVEMWLAKGESRPTLCFAVNRAHAATLAEQFHHAGVASAYVDAMTDSVDRARINRLFRDGEVQVICSVRTMTTGVDLPVSCIIDAAPTKSEMLHCLDAQTEILTSHGWKGIGQIHPGDCVASCVGVDQRAGQWALVKGAVRRPMNPSEKWVAYDSVHSNFRVTGDHRMIFGTGKRPFRYGTALEMASKSDGVKFPTAVTIHQPGLPLNSDELYFIGMMMTDGTWGASQGQISQSERHPEILERIEGVLGRLGIGYRKSPVSSPLAGEIAEKFPRWRYNMSVGMPKAKVGVGRFEPHPDSVRVDGQKGFRHLLQYLDKDLALPLMALSREQFLSLMSGLWDGDGFKKKGADYDPQTRQIITVRPVFADRIQALAVINGFMCNLRHYDPPGRARQYHLSFKDQDWRHGGGSGRAVAFHVSEATQEEVWCVETTTGNIVTRRDGKVTVMGNCQKIGRGLRVNPGSEDCLILDHAGNSLRLGLVTDIHHDKLDATKPGEKQERKAKAEKLPKECANCGTLQSGRICPCCGHERKPVADVETVDGELVQISGKVRTYTKAEKQEWWSGIQTIRLSRQRSTGWASHTYRDKFGCWPRGLDDLPGPASDEMWRFVKAKDIRFAKSKDRRQA